MTEAARSARFDRAAVLAAAGPKLDALKAEARNAFRLLRGAFGLAFLLPVAFIAGTYVFDFDALPLVVFIAFIVALLVAGFTAAKRMFAARSGVLEAVAPALGLTYAARATEPFDLSAFAGTYYQQVFGQIRCDDVLSGERAGTAFQIFDAKAVAKPAEPTAKPAKGFFKGFAVPLSRVVRVEVPGRWTARTVILRDAGAANPLQQPPGLKPVGLVDPRFEKIFEVYSTDQTEARALLDPVLMERLVTLEDLFTAPSADDSPPPVVAAFAQGVFLVAVPYANGRSARESRGTLTPQMIDALVTDQLLAEIDAVLGVVDAIAGEAGTRAP